MEKNRFIDFTEQVKKKDRVVLLMDLLMETIGLNPVEDMKEFWPMIKKCIVEGNEAMLEMAKESMKVQENVEPVKRKRRSRTELANGAVIEEDENGSTHLITDVHHLHDE